MNNSFAQEVVNKTVYGYAMEYMVIDGKPFSFVGHNYLIDIYQDNHPYQVIEKAAQMGGSVIGMAKAFFVCDKLGMNTIYFFPTDEDVREFSKGRVAPIIRDSPHLSAIVGDVDAVGLRSVGRGFLYFRGMRSKIRMKCHDEQTEVLTKTGWKHFSDVTHDDLFATRSPSGIFMWQKASKIWSYQYDGDMVSFNQSSLDALVTPNHRMLLRAASSQNEWFEFAENVPKGMRFIRGGVSWQGDIPDFIIQDGRESWGPKLYIELQGAPLNNRWPNGKHKPSRRIDLKDWVAFLGLYVAEGSCAGVAGGDNSTNRISISQTKPANIEPIRKLLARIHPDWIYNGSDFRVSDPELAKLLRPLGSEYEKYIPDWVKNLPVRYLELLWQWAVLGNGHIQHGHARYGTTSKRLAGDMQELLVKCGRNGSVTKQKAPINPPIIRGREIISRVIFYNVFEHTSVVSVTPKPKKVYYSGKVACVSVPNGVILTRRNGQTLWSGNSTPADLLVFDELDEVTDDQFELADQRLNHSSLKWRYMLSTPTFDNYGIDREFRKSDQRYWNLVCRKCDTFNILEKLFPDCLRRVSETKVILICRKCESELDTQYGVWLAERKTDRIRGYHLCSLYGVYTDLSELMYKFEEGRNREEFFRSKLGMPWVSTDQKLTPEIVERCCEVYQTGPGVPHAYMGVDQRGAELHVVIRVRDRITKRLRIVYINRVKKFQELDHLMRVYDVDLAVVDGMPEQHSAREFCKRFPGRAYMNFYHDSQRGSYKWSESANSDSDYQVVVNRTESLDAMFEEITRREVQIPSPTDTEVVNFIKHLCNIARLNEKDDEGNIKAAIYKKLGEDHYAHANNYSLIAASKFGTTPESFLVQSPLLGMTVTSRRYEQRSPY